MNGKNNFEIVKFDFVNLILAQFENLFEKFNL